MNPILQALSSGYSANTILKYISKINPEIAEKIKNALALGYSTEKIMKYIMQGGESLGLTNKSSSAQEMSIYDKMQYNVQEGPKALGKIGLGLGAIAAGSFMQAPQAMQPMMPKQIAQGAPPETPVPPIQPVTPGQQIGAAVKAPIAQAMQPAAAEQIAAAAPAVGQEIAGVNLFEQLLGGQDISQLSPSQQKQLSFLSMVADTLQKEGKNIQDPGVKKLSRKIKDVLSGKPGLILEESARFEEQFTTPSAENMQFKPLSDQSLKKGQTVVTEEGEIADIESFGGNKLLIKDANGKLKQVSLESLRAQPQAIEEAKIVFDPSKIPEEEKSAALAFSIPMPDRSAILNIFHDGSMYIYKRKDNQPIDEGIVRRIIDGTDIPITKGKTFMGAWDPSKGDSRGAASYRELVSLAQSSEDVDDPTKPLLFEKITDSYAHPYHREFMKLLKELTRHYGAKPKKEKKRKA